MTPPTLAQRLLLALGLEPQAILLGHKSDKSPSFTKKGPGRKHQQGKRK